jgi:hypothetical protein
VRRPILFIVVFLALVVVALRVAMVAGDFDETITAVSFEDIRGDHTRLRAFLDRMPKGGDLHTHLSGAVYAERYIAWAAERELCVNSANVVVEKRDCNEPGAVPVADALRDQKLYDRLVDAFSMRGFLPTPALPTGHDEFFATFARFDRAGASRFVDMVIDQLRRYVDENVQYVEFMVSFSCASDREKFRNAIAGLEDDAARQAALEASGLADCVAATRTGLAAAIGRVRNELACDSPAPRPPCAVTFRFIAQVLRNDPLDDVFIRTAIAAALIRAEPLIVALNFVGPEDALVARRDYTRHMQIVRFLASDVPVALHAGELWLGLVPPPDLTFHIREAIEIAGARRIGHGVSLPFERGMDGLLAEMRSRPVAVEINLTSNDLILGVRANEEPFPTYVAAGVPVVLSSDDAGVSRITLGNEYFRAARDYGFGYRLLKAIARNALIYSFLDEGQKRAELARFDGASREFERAVVSAQSPLDNVVALIRAAVNPAL